MQDASRHLVHTAVSTVKRMADCDEPKTYNSRTGQPTFMEPDEAGCETLTMMVSKELANLSAAFQQCEDDKLPKTIDQLQEFVDEKLGVVPTIINAAKKNKLTLAMLESAGVQFRQKSKEHSNNWMELHSAGLWQSSEDAQRFEDSKNSYIGTKFIEWYIFSSVQAL